MAFAAIGRRDLRERVDRTEPWDDSSRENVDELPDSRSGLACIDAELSAFSLGRESTLCEACLGRIG